MKFWIVLLLMSFTAVTQAQQVINNGNTYEVVGKTILKDGADITETLSAAEQKEIRDVLKDKLKADKLAEKLKKDAEKVADKLEKERKKTEKNIEKERKRIEKDLKKAEKEKKKAEKALKNRLKAQDKLRKAEGKLIKAEEKYKSLKFKGKLSPNDEAKWLKDIRSLEEKVSKAKRKM